MLQAIEDAARIDIEGVVEDRAVPELVGPRPAGDAGIIEGEIEPAESGDRGFDHRLYRVLIPHIGMDIDRLAACLFDHAHGLMPTFIGDIIDRDLGAGVGEGDSCRSPDPAAPASDERDFACEFRIRHVSPRFDICFR